jgi:hypothetical protein
MVFLDLENGRMRKVVVMGMADANSVDNWNIFYIAWFGRISLWSHEVEWRASILEDRVEENAQARREFDIVASVA